MKIQAKIFLFIFMSSFLVFTLVIGYIAFDFRKLSIEEASKQTNDYAKYASRLVKSELEKDLDVCKTLVKSFEGYNNVPKQHRVTIYEGILKDVLESHPEHLALWMSWELMFTHPNYNRNYGRSETIALSEAGVVNIYRDTLDLDGDDYASNYYKSKTTQTDIITSPYYHSYDQSEYLDSAYKISIAKPIVVNSEFAGMVGIDLPLERFDQLIEKIKPFEKSNILLISNNGLIISSSMEIKQADSLIKAFPKLVEHDVLLKIKEGDPFSIDIIDTTGISNHVSFSPIRFEKNETPWYICLVVPSEIAEQRIESSLKKALLIGLGGIFIFSITILLIARGLTQPLKQTTSILKELDSGIIDLSKKIKVSSKDEIAEMGKSINKLMDTLFKTAEFAKKIGQGDFKAVYKASGKYDVLGNALIEMQKSLQVGQEQEVLRQLERKKLNWAQDGLTELSEVLRTSTDDFEEYLLSILSYILKYIKADQGAIFLINTIDPLHPFLELRSAYAYNKKKSLDTKLEIGESLVGRCFQEKEVIYMTNIPEGYTFVSSGLGGHAPRSLFLMPLLFEDEPFGVIEIASFHMLEDFEIDFLKSIGERIASSISVMEKNVQTKGLLEQYKVQSNELQSREKMLQENLQELRRLEEDIQTNEQERTGIIETLQNIATVAWYDMDSTLLKVKDHYLSDMGMSPDDLVGKKQTEYLPAAKESPEEFKEFWDDLRAGKIRTRVFEATTTKGKVWVSETYTPIKDSKGKPVKVVNIGLDITKERRLEEKIAKMQAELDQLKKGS